MKHLFRVLLVAMVALFAASWSHAPPPIDQPVVVASTPNCDNLNVSFDTNTPHYAVCGATTQLVGTLPGAVPAAAHLSNGEHQPGPMARTNLYPTYAEREKVGRHAKPAASGHPLRC